MAKSKQQLMSDMRKEHAQDLRKAHFHLGFDQGFDDETRYRYFYKAYNTDGAEQTKQDMLKLRKDLRSTHYLLGTDEPSKLFISTATSSFQQPVNPQIAKLSTETKNDLRSHHFTMGNNKEAAISDYKRNYDSKGIDQDALKDRKEQINALRKHNHEFGDPKDYYSSLYDQNFNLSYDPQFLHQGKSKEEIKQEIVNLRKTNLVLGNHTNPQFNTESSGEYKNLPQANRTKVELGLKKTHFSLGEDKPNYETTVKTTFQGAQLKQHDPAKIKALSKDLRAEHFSMGNEPRSFKSEAVDQYQDIDRTQLSKQPDLSYLYKSHFDLQGFGGANPVQQYVSNYKQNYVSQEQIKSQQARNDRADRNSHIVLGSDKIPGQFTSEAADSFLDFGKQKPSALEIEAKENLRKHHYQFGTDKLDFITETKDSFVDKTKESQKSKLDPALIKDLRSNHFVYGTQKNQFGTTMQDIGKYQGNPSKLDPALAKDLRSHHFKAEDHHQYYNTSYRIDYVDPEAV